MIKPELFLPLLEMNKKAYGFTLIELAIVLFIISLILVGLLGPVASQIEAKERQQTIDMMNDALEALYGFAVINGRLPCPDTDGDGLTNPTPHASGGCTATEGWLPWSDLNTHQADVWGNRFRYRVDQPGFTTLDDGVCGAADNNLDLCETGNIIVQTRGDDVSTLLVTENKFAYNAATQVPAIIVSHGKNGFGATTAQGTARALPTVGTDEDVNRDGNVTYMSRIYSEGVTGCTDDANEANGLCVYDDILVWISPNVLMNRLVKAERLP